MSSRPKRFSVANPPTSLDAAHERRTLLVTEMKSLDVDLGSFNRIDPATGMRMEAKAYWAWRDRARAARAAMEREIIFINAWVAKQVNTARDERACLRQEEVSRPKRQPVSTIFFSNMPPGEVLKTVHGLAMNPRLGQMVDLSKDGTSIDDLYVVTSEPTFWVTDNACGVSVPVKKVS